MNLYFNTDRSVFKFDPTLQNIIWRSGGNGIEFIDGEEVILCSLGTASAPDLYVDKVSFGDSYDQVTESGINSVRDIFDVLFKNKRREVARALQRFFKGEPKGSIYNRRVSEWFYWLPPSPFYLNKVSEPMKVRCESFNVSPNDYNSWDIKAKFVQTFEP